MGRYIVKLENYYFEYSEVVDAPITFGMDLGEFKEYYKEEYGDSGMRELEGRLKRVGLHGTSSMELKKPEKLMSNNRAGPDEKRLSIKEIYKAYCLREPIKNGWTVPIMEVDDE